MSHAAILYGKIKGIPGKEWETGPDVLVTHLCLWYFSGLYGPGGANCSIISNCWVSLGRLLCLAVVSPFWGLGLQICFQSHLLFLHITGSISLWLHTNYYLISVYNTRNGKLDQKIHPTKVRLLLYTWSYNLKLLRNICRSLEMFGEIAREALNQRVYHQNLMDKLVRIQKIRMLIKING